MRPSPKLRTALPAAPEPAPTLDGDVTVTVLRWPEQQSERARLADRHRPRLLLCDPALPEPVLDEHLEVALGMDATPAATLEAIGHLQRLARHRLDAPHIDEHGLLRFGGRWVYVPDGQIALLELLVRRCDQLVSRDDLREVYERTGGSWSYASQRSLFHRLGQRVAEVGLALRVVRSRGVMLKSPR